MTDVAAAPVRWAVAVAAEVVVASSPVRVAWVALAEAVGGLLH
jgi:hypothetical protein